MGTPDHFLEGIRGHLIGGRPGPSKSGETFVTYDPSTGAPMADVALGRAAEVDAAVDAAREALPSWRRMDPMRRTRLLLRLAELIEAHTDELGETESRDVGKPVADATGKDL